MDKSSAFLILPSTWYLLLPRHFKNPEELVEGGTAPLKKDTTFPAGYGSKQKRTMLQVGLKAAIPSESVKA